MPSNITKALIGIAIIIALLLIGSASTSLSFLMDGFLTPFLDDLGVHDTNVQNLIIFGVSILGLVLLLLALPKVRKAIWADRDLRGSRTPASLIHVV